MTTNSDSMEKTRAKSRGVFNGASLVPGNPGNTGGKPGRSGRVPDAFRAMCRELASRDETLAAVDQILRDADHPMFIAALKWATEQGYGKPTEHHELSGPDGAPLEHIWKFGDRVVPF